MSHERYFVEDVREITGASKWQVYRAIRDLGWQAELPRAGTLIYMTQHQYDRICEATRERMEAPGAITTTAQGDDHE